MVASTSLFGTTRATPFSQYLGRQTIVAAANTSTITNYAYSTLLSDVSDARLVRIQRFTVRFYPVAVASTVLGTITSRVAAQLQIVDPATGYIVPITPIRPLSSVSATVLTGMLPLTNWVATNVATINGLVVSLWNNDAAVIIPLDIETYCLLAQDKL